MDLLGATSRIINKLEGEQVVDKAPHTRSGKTALRFID
jgi:hypothetical protein